MPRLGTPRGNNVFVEVGMNRTLYVAMTATRPGRGKADRVEMQFTNRQARQLATMLLKVAEQSDRDEDRVESAEKAEAEKARSAAPPKRKSKGVSRASGRGRRA